MALGNINIAEDLLKPKQRDWIDFGQTEDKPLGLWKKELQLRSFQFLQLIIQAQGISICPFTDTELAQHKLFIQTEATIRGLIEDGNIAKARDELAKVPEGVSKSLDKWKRLLAEPVIKPGTPASGQGMQSDLLWIQNNLENYRGQWVALKKGELIGNNTSRVALQGQLRVSRLLEGVTFFKIEE